jgi:hypothetical protein
MKNFLFIFGILLLITLYISCGGAAKKEKARQESIKKAEEEAKQKAEQDKKQAFQDLLNACKEEEKGKPMGVICKDVDKKEVRYLIDQGKLRESANRFSTLGKRKVETGYIVCVYEYFDEREAIMGGLPTKMYDMNGWLFSIDQQGNVLDKFKFYEVIGSDRQKESEPDTYNGHILPNTKDFMVELVIGKQYGIDFTGERSRYKLENGKFKETSRKKVKETWAD